MNDLIKSVFGDPSITLACRSSECLHYTQLPGYVPPSQSLNKRLVIASLVGALLIIAGGIAAYRLLIQITQEKSGFIALPTEDDSSKLMAGHLPATLQFSDVSYNDNEKLLLAGLWELSVQEKLWPLWVVLVLVKQPFLIFLPLKLSAV